MDYYSILEIEEDSNFEQIRKAYKKQALKYHPDKNKNENAEDKFKNVVEAYEVLSNPLRRERYDISRKMNKNFEFKLSPEILKFTKFFFCEENLKKFANMTFNITNDLGLYNNAGFDYVYNNILDNLRNKNIGSLFEEYKNFKKFYHINTNNNEINKKKNVNNKKTEKNYNNILEKKKIIYNLKIKLEDIYNNIIRNISINLDKKCIACGGRGVITNRKTKNKSNKKNKKKKNNSFLDKKLCSTCKGTMKKKTKKVFRIDCTKDSYIFENEFFINNELPEGDIVINLITNDSLINRINRYDLSLEIKITINEFYNGGEVNFIFLDGKDYNIKYEKLENLDPELRKKYLNNYEREEIIENKGLPIILENELIDLQNINKLFRGDLIIKLKLELPYDFNYDSINNNQNN